MYQALKFGILPFFVINLLHFKIYHIFALRLRQKFIKIRSNLKKFVKKP